jgi:hypothetical protein
MPSTLAVTLRQLLNRFNSGSASLSGKRQGMSVKSETRELAKLYSAIPKFECKPGCSDCCGPVPMARPEWQKVRLAKRQSGQDCMSCEFLIDNRCSVYADRPFLCRLFGATKDAAIACPHGCGPANPLTTSQALHLKAQYQKIVGPTPAGYTADIGRLQSHLETQSLLAPVAGNIPADLMRLLRS